MSSAKALVQIIAAIAAIIPAVIPALSSDMGVTEWVNVAILAVGAYEVWNADNNTVWPNGKVFASIAMSVLLAVNTVIIDMTFLDGGVTSTEWVQLVIAVLAPIGVYITTNRGTTTTPA